MDMDPAVWEKAKEVLTGALELPPADRTAFLLETCPDPALRSEIEALLKQYDEAPDFLEAPASIEDFDVPDEFPPGTHVGPYVIIDRLGHGGMGEVFLGNDPRLHRKVALKCLIASSRVTDDQRPRILHEAR